MAKDVSVPPSGKPTKNPLTGKVVPLDPSTHEYHECKLDRDL